jgi:hypothetical protein
MWIYSLTVGATRAARCYRRQTLRHPAPRVGVLHPIGYGRLGSDGSSQPRRPGGDEAVARPEALPEIVQEPQSYLWPAAVVRTPWQGEVAGLITTSRYEGGSCQRTGAARDGPFRRPFMVPTSASDSSGTRRCPMPLVFQWGPAEHRGPCRAICSCR